MSGGLSRRRFVYSAAALAGASAWSVPLLAKGKPANLRDGEILPDPDFSLLREKDPFLIGIRPYRTSGVRLEVVAEPLQAPSGAKRLIHNYGHGGAGVTLSWGCASVVVEMVEPLLAALDVEKRPKAVAVLGTGVIGLTTATELKRRWPDLPVTVYAKSLDLKDTVSWVAGGQIEPSGMHRLYKTADERKILHDWMRRAKTRIEELQNGGQRHAYGVAVRKNYTLDRALPAIEEGTPRDVIGKPRKGRLPFARLNAPGREYQTWLMNPSILMPRLIEDLKGQGVRFEQRAFTSLKDIADLAEPVVVNCTGYGSRQLFGDEDLVPQRGHNVLLQRTDEKHFYFFSGGCENFVIAYIFCRQDDIVVGGTIQKGNDSLARTPDDEQVFQRLLSNGRELFGGRPKGCVRS